MPKSSNAVHRRFARLIQSDPAAAPSNPSLWCDPYSWGPVGVGLPVCWRGRGTPSPYSRAVVQARRCDPTAVAAREDRRAQVPEEPVRRYALRALHASRPPVPQCGAGSSTDATLRSSPIRSATSQSRACTRGPPVGVGVQSVHARPAPQLVRRDVSKNALRELPECVCNMGSLTSLYAPPEASIHLEAFVAGPSRALLPQERGAQRAASAA